jgi:membrane protein YqaA with SNARE-associated domain
MNAAWEGIGLYFVALCDSSFISLPEVNDLLVIYFCTRFEEYAYLFALSATLGSVTGCTILYGLGRWKGYGFLLRRYSQDKLDRVLGIFQEYGVFALVVPALWPPPLPFKIFILMAGILGLSFPRFLGTIALARGFRYFAEASFAIRYGDQTIAYLKDNFVYVMTFVVVLLLCLSTAFFVITYIRSRKARLSNRQVILSSPE